MTAIEALRKEAKDSNACDTAVKKSVSYKQRGEDPTA
jgi:hypothetical protein